MTSTVNGCSSHGYLVVTSDHSHFHLFVTDMKCSYPYTSHTSLRTPPLLPLYTPPHTSLPTHLPYTSLLPLCLHPPHTYTHAPQTLKWNFALPRSEHVEQLKEQLQPCVSSALFTQLFHDDFKHHLTALATLTKVGGVRVCI